jgi:hypothetical protein
MTRKCHDKAAATCRKCEAEARAAEKRRQRDHNLDQERQAKQRAYAARLAEIEDEIEHQKNLLSHRADEQNRQNALAQKEQDLLNLKKKVKNPVKVDKPPETTKAPTATSPKITVPANRSTAPKVSSEDSQSDVDEKTSEKSEDSSSWDTSQAKDDWNEQKQLWGAENEALDTLMSMIGKYCVHR